MIDPIEGNILKSNVNSYIGMLFVGSVGLLAAIFMLEASFGYNPLVQAFEATIYRHSTYVPSLP